MGKPSALIKPTLDTRFHIDYEWWERETNEELHTYLLSHLLSEQRDRLSQNPENTLIDYVDPDTGEVLQLDQVGLAIQEAIKDPNFINPHTSLVDSIFRVFLSNGNTPLTPRELGSLIDKPPAIILRTLSGTRVYKGIRPVLS